MKNTTEPQPDLIRKNAANMASDLEILEQNVQALDWYVNELVQELNSASKSGHTLSDVHITLAYSFLDLMRSGVEGVLRHAKPAAAK